MKRSSISKIVRGGMTKPGPAIPASPRHERFIELLLDGAMSQTEAWCHSVTPPLPKSPAARVAGSRVAKQHAERIAYLKQQRATPEIPEDEEFTVDMLRLKMVETTQVLIDAAGVAHSLGHTTLSNSIRSEIVAHSGRLSRLEGKTQDAPTPTPTFDVDALCGRVYRCTCDDE